MLSASNLPLPNDHDNHPTACAPTTVLLLPAFIFIDNVTPATVPDLIRHHINPAPKTTTPLPKPNPSPHPSSEPAHATITDTLSTAASDTLALATTAANTLSQTLAPLLPTASPFTLRPCPHRALILLCSQRTRDARCGQSAPLLLREFNRHLRALGLQRDMHDERPGGVGVYFISHVGGHKFAANVMVYRRWQTEDAEALEEDRGGVRREEWGEGSQCIWLGRVRPEDCEGIVKQTVLKGKVVKPERQLRGGFDRERGLVSW